MPFYSLHSIASKSGGQAREGILRHYQLAIVRVDLAVIQQVRSSFHAPRLRVHVSLHVNARVNIEAISCDDGHGTSTLCQVVKVPLAWFVKQVIDTRISSETSVLFDELL